MERRGLLVNLPRLDKCCCCIDLRVGAIVLGVLELLECLWSIGKTFSSSNEELKQSYEVFGINLSDDQLQRQKMSTVVGAAVGLVFSMILLIGAIQRKALLLKVYIIVNMICVVILGILSILIFFFFPVFGIILFIYLAIALYYLFCVNSYLQELLDEENVNVPVTFKPV